MSNYEESKTIQDKLRNLRQHLPNYEAQPFIYDFGCYLATLFDQKSGTDTMGRPAQVTPQGFVDTAFFAISNLYAASMNGSKSNGELPSSKSNGEVPANLIHQPNYNYFVLQTKIPLLATPFSQKFAEGVHQYHQESPWRWPFQSHTTPYLIENRIRYAKVSPSIIGTNS